MCGAPRLSGWDVVQYEINQQSTADEQSDWTKHFLASLSLGHFDKIHLVRVAVNRVEQKAEPAASA
jgi:hypothetical protein